MQRNYRGSKEPRELHQDFEEILYQDEPSHHSSNRQAERKTRQFCRQVQRALNVAFAGIANNQESGGLFVEEVLPAPDCGHLLVRVLIPPHCTITGVLLELSRQTPRLRAEVAMAITRKRAPELCFVPADPDGGGNE